MILTDNQRRVLFFVNEYRQNNGIGPSFREILEILDVSSIRSVHVIVEQLTSKGYLENDQAKFRSLKLTNEGRRVLHLDSVKIGFSESFPTYRRGVSETYRKNGVSVLSTNSDLTYNGQRSIRAGGTTIQNSDSGIVLTDSKTKELPNNGAGNGNHPFLNFQNSTINMPLSSLDIDRIEKATSEYEYLLPVALSFVLIALFDKGSILWFFILTISILFTKKFNKLFKE